MNQSATLLLVDDEVNVLKSLMRLLHAHNYRLLMAASGTEALALMAREPVDLVISDMRMPHMDGAELLAKIRQQWPDTMRLLLTGHADMTQTVAAINQGEIYRYIAKPWHDDELLLIVAQALEQQKLKRENARLQQLTAEQNAALREANTTLEQKVAQRTAELSQLVSFLEMTQQELKTSFRTSLQVLANMLDMRFADWVGHSQRVVDVAEQLARMADVGEEEFEAIRNAAQLHDIGKIALPDALVNKPFLSCSRQERSEVMEHPALGQMVLLPIPELNRAGALIRHIHEHYDGTGFPDRLHSDSIPLGARILAIAVDYDELQMGLILPQAITAEHALLYIRENKGQRYDPDLVSLMVRVVDAEQKRIREVALGSSQLKPGMKLSRDLFSASRFLLLTRGRVLDEAIIQHIWHFERTEGKAVTVYVVQP
jgi:Response regulator containing a CheY-like receiver domain and an HD-GYP domain